MKSAARVALSEFAAMGFTITGLPAGAFDYKKAIFGQWGLKG
jgi:hypothetical protein